MVAQPKTLGKLLPRGDKKKNKGPLQYRDLKNNSADVSGPPDRQSTCEPEPGYLRRLYCVRACARAQSAAVTPRFCRPKARLIGQRRRPSSPPKSPTTEKIYTRASRFCTPAHGARAELTARDLTDTERDSGLTLGLYKEGCGGFVEKQRRDTRGSRHKGEHGGRQKQVAEESPTGPYYKNKAAWVVVTGQPTEKRAKPRSR
jgi:hypothetical protein